MLLFWGLLALSILFFRWRLHWGLFHFFASTGIVQHPKILNIALKWRHFKPWNQGLTVYGPKKYRISTQTSFQHLLIEGGSGVGKTRRIIRPSIQGLAKSGHSMFVFDPSGEILQAEGPNLQKRGYGIQCLNLIDPQASLGYNPLAKIQGPLEIGQMARILLNSSRMDRGEPFWSEGAQQLLEIGIHAALQQKNAHLGQVLKILQYFQSEQQQKSLKEILPPEVRDQLEGLLATNERVLSSFHAVALNSLRILNIPDLAELLSRDQIQFQALREARQAIFLLLPIEKIAYYGFIMNLFYTGFFNHMMRRLPLPHEKPVFALLDEFPVAKIENIDTIISVIRKHGVSLTLAIQSQAQMRVNYGERAPTLMDNCHTHIRFNGSGNSKSSPNSMRSGGIQCSFGNHQIIQIKN